MIISLDAEKLLTKIQHPLKINVLENIGIEETYLNMIKSQEIECKYITLGDEEQRIVAGQSQTPVKQEAARTQ